MEVIEEPIARLPEHGDTPIAFMVHAVLEPRLLDGGLGGVELVETPVGQPWLKDYDAIDGEGPIHWAQRFDVSNWGLLSAVEDGRRLGGAVIAFDTSGVHMLEGRSDLAVLWDIRVRPGARTAGIGGLLFSSVEQWSRDRGCSELKVETQNINVPACHFYRRMGCELAAINRRAYTELPDEAQMIWTKSL